MSKKITVLPLFLALGCLVGCGNNNNPVDPKPVEQNLDIWSISSGEKVFQDQPASVYKDIRGEAKIDIYAFKGEHEAKQLIITPTADVKCYDAEVTDLKNASGQIISKEKVSIYSEKYVALNQIFDTASTFPIGKCPDGLVPIEASKKRNDNQIKGGQNQGLYIDVDVAIDQAPGVYEGNVNLDIDGTKKVVPMKVTVNDVLVNEETHSKSVFLDHWQFWNGEMDSSESMYDKYHYMLGEYRLAPMYAIFEGELNHNDAGIKRYVDKTYDILTNSKANTICIPYGMTTTQNQTCFDENIMKRYIKKFFDKSIETNFNILEHLVVYFGFIDEPYEFGLMERTRVVCERYKVCIAEVCKELETYKTESPMHDELVESARKIRNCVTTQYQEEYDDAIDSYCPKIRFYDTAEQRANYDKQEEKWWYTCVDPRMPYPTYHTEDTLSSPRLLSWMQSHYDVVGNLFWAVNVYAQQSSSGYMPIEDYFTGDAAHYNGCNGDGYLMYPGKQYGIDGPVPSLRLEAIRDGYEEYELFYNLKEKAKSLQLNDKAVFDLTTLPLYNGTKILGSSEGVEKARKTLGELTIAMNNGSDFIVNKCDLDYSTGDLDLQFYAKAGSNIKVQGQSLSQGNSFGEGYLFDYKTSCFKDNNDLTIEVSYGDKTTSISTHVLGAVKNYTANELLNSFSKYNSSVTASKEVVGDLGELLKLSIGKPRDAKQSIKFIPSFLSELTSGVRQIDFTVYNPTSSSMKFSLGWRNSRNTYDTYLLENMEINPGLNHLSFPTLNLRLGSENNINYFFMVFGDSSSKDEQSKDFYFKNISVYYK